MGNRGIEHDEERETLYSAEADADDNANQDPVKHPVVEISALWLRRIGGESGVYIGVELLAEINGQWYIVIQESLAANFSRIAEARAAGQWRLSPMNEDPK